MQSKSNARPSPPSTRALKLVPGRKAARLDAAATYAQLQAMQALTDTALSHLALDDLLRELLGRVTAVMGVDHVGILLLDADGQTLTIRAARGVGEEHVGLVQVPVGRGVIGRIVASRAPVIVDDVAADDLDGSPSILLQKLRSTVGVPLLVEDQVVDWTESQRTNRLVGVLGVGSEVPRRFTEADVQLLQRAADRVALAIDRTRLYAAEQDARRQAEVALARAQASEAQAAERAERLHTILETIADGVAVYDAAGHALQINRAYHEMLAVDRAPSGFETLTHFERVRLLDMRDASGAPLPSQDIPIARALRGEVATGPRMDVHVRAFDGRELELNNSAAPLREPDGRIVGAVVVLRDMTERNRLACEREAARADELAARAASRRMEAFLAVAAHDLRTPLTTTVGYLTLAQRKTERLVAAAREASPTLARQADAVRSSVAEADQSAARLARLLTLLFDTATLRAGKLELHREPCDLAALVREQVAALRVAAPERTIRLHAPADGAPNLVEADADRIGQVVANYVTNALKYSPPDRPVEVSVVARAGRARVAVCDQGPGIPEAERGRVWELFHRAAGVRAQDSAQGSSLGLGLYICQVIITAHGGQVGVRSRVGVGSTFWFTLPLSRPDRSESTQDTH